MSNITGLLLSITLILPTILFGVDLLNIGQLQTSLEARATIVSYQISNTGGLRQTLIDELLIDNIHITCHQMCEYVTVGELITYDLITYYSPIILSADPVEIVVTRTTIVGYL